MDITLLIVIVCTIICGGVLLYFNGWKGGLLQLFVIFGFLAVYISTIKFFGVDAKKYLAIFLLLFAAWMLYARHKKKKS